MKMINPFQINDIDIKGFLKIILTIQLATWAVMGLDTIGIQIPILRQFIGFIYLTFIPGIIILRIIKLHKLGNIETLLYTVGLSIATLMFTGLFMNTVYPLFGISGPISITPLIITMSILVLILCVLCYIRDKDFSDPSFIDVRDVLSPPALFLCLVPFLAIFGTYLVNFYQNNILLMFLIVIIAIIAILIGFDKFIPKNLYPLAVFVIAISLLYHNSLISMYIWGWDIHHEFYLINLLMENTIWDPTMPGTCNTLLSLVMLAPIYSIITDMSLTWVFKISYPLVFSLVPLGLYRVFQKQTGEKIAFLACFFFVSLFTFYGEMLALARQQIAELFLVLLILVMIDKIINKTARAFLFIVFGISLVVSHYGLSYIYMFCLIAAWLLLVFMDSPAMQKSEENFHSKFCKKREDPSGDLVPLKVDRAISSTFVLLFVTFTLAWYMYLSNASTFNAIVQIGDHIASSLFTDFLNPEAAQGLATIITKTVSPLHSVTKYLHLLSLFFIAVGIITLILKHREMKFEREYFAFSLIFFGICLGGIVLPYFASSLNTSRLYQISLIFLAPFYVIGGITVFRAMSGIVRASWTNESVRSSLKVLSVFLVIFLLFNTGFVYEVAKDCPVSISLSQVNIKEYGDAKMKAAFYSCYTPEQDVFSARWLSKIKDDTTKVYADYITCCHVLQSYGGISHREHACMLFNTTTAIETGAYVYMSYVNTVFKISSQKKHGEKTIYNTTEIRPLIVTANKIYSNGGSNILRS